MTYATGDGFRSALIATYRATFSSAAQKVTQLSVDGLKMATLRGVREGYAAGARRTSAPMDYVVDGALILEADTFLASCHERQRFEDQGTYVLKDPDGTESRIAGSDSAIFMLACIDHGLFEHPEDRAEAFHVSAAPSACAIDLNAILDEWTELDHKKAAYKINLPGVEQVYKVRSGLFGERIGPGFRMHFPVRRGEAYPQVAVAYNGTVGIMLPKTYAPGSASRDLFFVLGRSYIAAGPKTRGSREEPEVVGVFRLQDALDALKNRSTIVLTIPGHSKDRLGAAFVLRTP